MGVVFKNSEFINENDLIIKGSNRAFNYGDGFFETIKIVARKPFNFSVHYLRYCFACSVLKLDNRESESSLLSLMIELIKQNNVVNGSVKIHVSRSGDGKYLPDSSVSEIFITANNGSEFEINKPMSLCIFSDEVKAKGKLSNVKSINALVSVLGAMYAKEKGFDNAILQNVDANYIETSNSNLFIVKKGSIYTPPLSDGCVDGTMRNWIFKQENVIEKSLSLTDLQEADEVFLSNAISGILAVIKVDKISFITFRYAEKLQKKLINLSLGL